MKQISSRTVAALLCLTWAVAYLVRYRYLIINGGLEPDYMIWANQYYFGGITAKFEAAANAILMLNWGEGGRTYPPTYPVLLAMLKLVSGFDLQLARFFQIGLDSLGVFLVYGISRRLGCQPGVSIMTALGYAIVPWWAWGSSPILADSIIPLLVLVLVLAALRAKAGRDIDWLLLGLVGSVLSLARSEFGLLCLAILVLAAIGAPGARIRAMFAGMTGFWLPWLAVATLNYHTSGNFFPAANATFYALFSGLGQIPNDFGYFISDGRAIEVLAAKGLLYHSPEAEDYWRSIYFNAWLERPGHVLHTIFSRLDLIAFHQEIAGSGITDQPLLRWGFGTAVAASAILLYRRRFYDTLIVAGPLLFALFTLGLIYVELRYVRYASLTYLFSAAIVLSALVAWLNPLLRKTSETAQKSAAFLSFFLAYAALVAIGLLPLDTSARKLVREANPQNLEGTAMRAIDEFRPAVDGAEILVDGDNTRIVSSPTILGYQALAEIDVSQAELLKVELDVDVPDDATWYAGVLSEDHTRFHAQTVFPPGERTSELLVVDPRGDETVTMVFTAQTPSSPLTIHRLEAAKICGSYDFSLGWIMFPHTSNVPRVNVEGCPIKGDGYKN